MQLLRPLCRVFELNWNHIPLLKALFGLKLKDITKFITCRVEDATLYDPNAFIVPTGIIDVEPAPNYCEPIRNPHRYNREFSHFSILKEISLANSRIPQDMNRGYDITMIVGYFYWFKIYKKIRVSHSLMHPWLIAG